MTDFLKESRLTEENLKKLDNQIMKVLGDDQVSVHSHKSAASNKSKDKAPKENIIRDNVSEAGSEVSLKSIHSIADIEEDHDEWFLISKFNTEL